MIVYRERVLPSIWAAALPILLFPSVLAVMLPLNASWATPVALLITAAFVCYIYFSSPVIIVTEDEFIARGATIQRKFLGKLEVIEKKDSFEALGPKLDARAWLCVQASIKTLVKVEIIDPQDPTPYWMVSSRNPELLKKALKS